MQGNVEQTPERCRTVALDGRQARKRRRIQDAFADDVHPATASRHQHVATRHERDAPWMIESLCNDRHAIAIRAIAVLPRPIRELTASPVRGSATLLLLTTALAPAPLTL